MTKQPTITVVKVGGSLFDWSEFPRRLSEFLDTRRALDQSQRFVLIAGGGAAVDTIRTLDEIHRLGDLAAHRLALHTMDLTAVILAALVPDTVVVDDFAAMNAVWASDSVPILTPRARLEEEEDGSPESEGELGCHLGLDRRVGGRASRGGSSCAIKECVFTGWRESIRRGGAAGFG